MNINNNTLGDIENVIISNTYNRYVTRLGYYDIIIIVLVMTVCVWGGGVLTKFSNLHF